MKKPKYKIGDLVIETKEHFSERHVCSFNHKKNNRFRRIGIILDTNFTNRCTIYTFFSYTGNCFVDYRQHNLELISSYKI
jgi:hypothetical protein